MRGIDFNKDWKFKLAETLDSKAEKRPFDYWNPWYDNSEVYTKRVEFTDDDSNWELVRLPHDWSNDFEFDREKGEGCTGFKLGGTGWYRKYFVTTEEMIGKKVFVNFDGIYNRANIYCNGKFLTFHPYGYSPCLVEVTGNLKPVGEENVINVKVDHTRYADSRWYTGSGIYRKVSMYILPDVNIPVWGLYFTTPFVTSEKAVVAGDIELENNRDVDVRVCANIKIKDASGKIAVERNLERFLEAKQKEVLKAELDIKNPIFWDIDDPHQYTVVVEISVDGEKLQEESVKIGVRTCVVDVEKGFYLNGRNIKVYGACLHHDGGLVGAAVPDDVWRRRLSLLKDCGCNAIRTSHNPYSEDFLDLCDEMGFLVQAEFYDEWDYAKDKRLNCVDRIKDYITRGHDEFFQEYAKSDLQVVVKRDRNHPSIFQWSLGNEIEWAYPRLEHLSGYFDEHGADWGSMNPPLSIEEIKERIKAVPEEKYEIGKTANKLADWTREMDITRPITSNCVIPSASYHLGYTDALDIVGYSHRFNIYDYGFENYPNKHLNGCETGTPWYEYYLVQQRDYISALFVWTGISYMGEAHSKDKTQRGSNGAFVDFAGFKRDSFYVAKSWWEEKPMVFAATVVKDEKCMFVKNENGEIVEREEGLLWDKKANQRRPYKLEDSWTYKDGDEILVEAYSNCDEVTLYINGKEQGTVLVKDHIDKVCRWIVPYEAGEIKAVAKKGNEILEHIIKTASEFAKIAINCDKEKITTDFDSVAHIEVMLTDKDGTRIPKDDRKVSFVLEGAYINMGVDNGSAESFQHYKNDSVVTSKGRALMIVQGAEKGTIKVKAMVDDIVSDTIEIEVE